MKHKKKIFLTIILFILQNLPNGDVSHYFSERYNITHNLSGYVKFESYTDSRQVIGVAADHFLLLPENKNLDTNGKDKNANGQTQLVALESRLRYDFSAPDMCGAQTHATIEGDFFSNAGQINFFTDVRIDNLFRLRHAFITLDFEKISLLFGQTWHPTYIPECFADTISFNNGGPIDLYARMPQIRLTYHLPHVDIIASASSQITGFTSLGPLGLSNSYIRNAIMPNLHGQVRASYNNHFFGIGYDIKRLRPRLCGDPVGIDGNVFVTDESIISHAALAYYAHHGETFKICAKTFYAENGIEYGVVGGFAVHTQDPLTNRQTYTNMSVASGMLDIAFTPYNDCFEPGIMVGYLKNLGTGKTINMKAAPSIFAFGANVAKVVRIAPRCRWKYNNITFAIELEYTGAAYGTLTNENNSAKVKNSSWINNIRGLFATYFFF